MMKDLWMLKTREMQLWQPSQVPKTITDVLYIPKLNQCLLSFGQLLDKTYIMVFKDKTCKVSYPTGVKMFSIKMEKRRDWKQTKVESYSSHREEVCV